MNENERRADRGQVAVVALAKEANAFEDWVAAEVLETAIADILHFADRCDVHPEELMWRAWTTYRGNHGDGRWRVQVRWEWGGERPLAGLLRDEG